MEKEIGSKDATRITSYMSAHDLPISSLKKGEDGVLHLSSYTKMRNAQQFPISISIYPMGTGHEVYIQDENADEGTKGRKFENEKEFEEALEMVRYNEILDRIGKEVSTDYDVDDFISDEELRSFITEFKKGISSNRDPEVVFEKMCRKLSKMDRNQDVPFGQYFKQQFFLVGENSKERQDVETVMILNAKKIRDFAQKADEGG